MQRPTLNRTFLVGLMFGLVTAAAFGASGPLAKGLLDAGWSPTAAVAARVLVGGVALLPLGLMSLRGRAASLARGWRRMLLFGLVSVAVVQLGFFFAIQTLDVAVAILIEYLGIVMVVVWLWLRRGERPRALTIAGALLSILGLVFVLDVFGAGAVDPVGALWALLAGVGLASYFLISAETKDGLPGLALATGGLLIGGVVLLVAGLTGLAPFSWNMVDVELAGRLVPWWVDVAALGLVAAALSYATGVQASIRLGSKLAGFVGLAEVLFTVLWAALLLGELPGSAQLLGGALILVGVILVKLDEPAAAPAALPVTLAAEGGPSAAAEPGGRTASHNAP